MKKNFIYIVKTPATVFEAVFKGEIRDVNLWWGLPFVDCGPAPPYTRLGDIDWVEEVCEWHPTMATSEYIKHRDKIVK